MQRTRIPRSSGTITGPLSAQERAVVNTYPPAQRAAAERSMIQQRARAGQNWAQENPRAYNDLMRAREASNATTR